MIELKAEVLDLPAVGVGESPQWHEDALWYCDINGGRLIRYDASNGDVADWTVAGALGCIVPTEKGFAAGTDLGFEHITISGNDFERRMLAPVLPPVPGHRMNDGVADTLGRFWCGSMEPQRPDLGRLFCLERGEAQCVMEGFRIVNGLAFPPDGGRLYVSDSHPDIATIWVFDLVDGKPVNRRVFADASTLGGRPDGAAIDADGCYWIAASDSGRVVRLTPRGEIDMVIRVPTSNPTNIVFGGSDLRTAFITSLKPASGGNALAGCVFAVDMPVAGHEAAFYRP